MRVLHIRIFGTSLVVQWLGLHAPNAGGSISIPGQGTGSHVTQLKDLTFCICVDHNKLWKIIRREYQITLPVSWETCMQVKKQQLEHGTTDWFETGKGVHHSCMLSSCLFNSYTESVCVCVCVCVCVRSVVPDPLQPKLPARLLYPWGFSRQEYWTGLPCPPPGDLPNPGIKPRSPTLETDPLPSELPGKCEIHISPCEMPGWMNHKWESRLLGEISTTSVMQMIPT